MKKTLSLVCPHCQLKAELRIEEEAEMILMRCVSCSSPYLYFHGETFEVNEEEMDHLRSAEMKEVEGLIKFDENEKEDEYTESYSEAITPRETHSLKGGLVKESNTISKSLVVKSYPKRDKIIQRDEILNLVIDLETTEDVLEFIEKM